MMKYISFALIIITLVSCDVPNEPVIEEVYKNVNVERKYDATSKTFYFLTHIKHVDKDGNILKLRHAHANKSTGETVVEFAKRINIPAVAINASTMRNLDLPGTIAPNGVQIIDSIIIQDLKTTAYTLGIKSNNELVAFHPDIRAAEILNAGVKDALTAFMPIIENYTVVSDNVIAIRENSFEKHPRQVIAQCDNLDILILSCGGRGFDGEGMTAQDLIRVLLEKGVKFAYNLDGGGSVTTVINGNRITKQIDGDGTKDRLRPNFLYVQ